MSRPKKTSKGLSRYVHPKHGAWYFASPTPLRNPWTGKMQKWIKLCRISDGEAEMHSKLGELLKDRKLVGGTMPNLCEEWKTTKLARYTDAVRKEYERMADVIAEAFEEFSVAAVTTKDCADFLRSNFRGKANTARKYANVLRKMFKLSISEMGLRQTNPCDNLDLSDYETARREVDMAAAHGAIAAIRAAALTGEDKLPTESGPMFQCIVDMAYLLWQRAIDVRMLREAQIADGAIRFKPSKTKNTSGKVVDIIITPPIQTVLERAREIKKSYNVISPYLFPSQRGTPYTKSGLNSMWRRAKARAEVKLDVQFKDIRAIGATDAAKRGEQRAAIQKRLAHTSAQTTEIYIKEAIPETSSIDLDLPWSGKVLDIV